MKAMKAMKVKRVSKRMAKVRLPWWQDGRRHDAHEGGSYEEQGREGRQQEAVAAGQEDVRQGDWQVDGSRAEGSEGAWHQGLRGHQEGLAPLQEGARVLHPVIGRAYTPPPAECVG